MEPIISLIIGDPHFKSGCPEVYEYIDRITEIAKKQSPTFIVILGDVLDKHGVVEVEPHKAVEKFFDNLSNIAPTYVLMGNHDLINSSQFLTTNHIYGPFKKWPSLEIIDKPLFVTYKDKSFVFVPYTPPGKFEEALETLLEEGNDWENADCIFAHQEFRGCKLAGGKISVDGDEWSQDSPLVISGHMHEPHSVGENIMYPGNSIQHHYTDKHDKKVWIIKFNNNTREIKKIKIGLKQKIRLQYNVTDMKTDTENILKKSKSHIIQLHITDTSTELKSFRKSQLYTTLKNSNISIVPELIKPTPEPITKDNIEYITYEHLLHKIIYSKNKNIIDEFNCIFGTLASQKL